MKFNVYINAMLTIVLSELREKMFWVLLKENRVNNLQY